MQKSFSISLTLHILLVLLFLINLQQFRKTKKLSYHEFSVNLEMKKKNTLATNSSIKKTSDLALEALTNYEKSKDIKFNKLNLPHKEEKRLFKDTLKKNKEKKEYSNKSIKKTNKKITELKKTSRIEKPKNQDIFSKSIGNKNVSNKNINKKIATLSNNDIAIIKEQISYNWIKTPCPDNIKVELEIEIDSNCNIIKRSIEMMRYKNSLQSLACANSALRAAQKCEKLHLSTEKCKELSNESIVLHFNIKN